MVGFLGTEPLRRHFLARRFVILVKMPDRDHYLQRAAELVAEAQRFVYEQKGKIIRLKTAGVDTSGAERTLVMFETNLKVFEQHRDALQTGR